VTTTLPPVAAWARERFPLALLGVLVPAYAVAVLYGRALTHARLGATDVVAFAGVWAFFLLVRVVDEHKDYERDLVEHPGRVLQRGVVTLGQLKALAAVAVAVQLAVVAVTGTWLWWSATILWAALAARDFLLPWIEGRPVLYPLLHLPLSGLVCVWMAAIGGGRLSVAGYLAGALGVVLAGTVDVTRKLAPSAGRSYGTALGSRGAAAAGALAVAAHTAVLVSLCRLATAAAAPVPLLVAAAAVPLGFLVAYAWTGRPGPARAALAIAVPVQLAVTALALWRWSG
jgi:hypothetical protein